MRDARRRVTIAVAGLGLALFALALAWRYTPLSEYATPARVTAVARYAASKPWSPVALVAAYPVSAVVMFPRPLITLFAVVAFGPVAGFALAMCGVFLSSLSAYGAGRLMPAKAVERLTPPRLRDLRDVIRSRGLASALAVSIVPVAPFAVVGVAMGAMRVKLRHYVAGVLIGHLPWTLTTAILGHQLKRALADRAGVSPALIAGAIVFLLVTMLVVRRWFARECRVIRDADRG